MLLAMSPLGYVHDICYNNDMHTCTVAILATCYVLCLQFYRHSQYAHVFGTLVPILCCTLVAALYFLFRGTQALMNIIKNKVITVRMVYKSTANISGVKH